MPFVDVSLANIEKLGLGALPGLQLERRDDPAFALGELAQGQVNRSSPNLCFNVNGPLAAIVEILITQHFANDPLLEIAVKRGFLLRFNRAVANGVAPLAQDCQLRRIGRGGAGDVALNGLVVE